MQLYGWFWESLVSEYNLYMYPIPINPYIKYIVVPSELSTY